MFKKKPKKEIVEIAEQNPDMTYDDARKRFRKQFFSYLRKKKLKKLKKKSKRQKEKLDIAREKAKIKRMKKQRKKLK